MYEVPRALDKYLVNLWCNGHFDTGNKSYFIMKVVFFQSNVVGGYSIVNAAKNLLLSFPKDFSVEAIKPEYLTWGWVNRLRYSWQAMRRQGDVNHVFGDVHFLVFFLGRSKTVLTVFDCIRLMNSDLGPVQRWIYKLLWFTLPKYFCTNIITISEESKANLIRYAGFPKENISVIYVGVDSKFKKISLTQQEKDDLLRNKTGKKTILHISAPQSNKNVMRLIEGINGLGLKLIKVGGFTSEEEMLLKKYSIDCSRFENVSSELVVKIYNAVDCLVFPSLIEGFGMPIIEAQKCGCPVVTSNVSSLPEVAGQGALLIDPYSINSITHGITEVLSNSKLRADLVSKGLENARRFEWDKIALEHQVLYRRIYAGKGRGQ